MSKPRCPEARENLRSGLTVESIPAGDQDIAAELEMQPKMQQAVAHLSTRIFVRQNKALNIQALSFVAG